MAIFSRWRADRGGYDYFESPHAIGLGDDLPVPRLSNTTALGVASTDIGRSLPAGARRVGSGRFAKGSIVPLSRVGLGAVIAGSGLLGDAVLVGLGLLGGWWLWKRRR